MISPTNDRNDSPRSSTTLNYGVVQINGRRVIGPPTSWNGPPPGTECELYIKNIPKEQCENDIYPHLQRFGTVYEFRLMMDYNNQNRGYAYVRYACEIDALRALEVMNHFLTNKKKYLKIERSYDKCRLFAGNIPIGLCFPEVWSEFNKIFPQMSSLLLYNKMDELGQRQHQSRGYALICFPDHGTAVNAKKVSSPGILHMWERDIKIVWAIPKRFSINFDKVKTLFIRHVHASINAEDIVNLIVTSVAREAILKVTRIREIAFIEFRERSCAEKIKQEFQGKRIMGHTLDIEWAFPPNPRYFQPMCLKDHDAVLRLKCIANMWTIPVIIMGRVLEVPKVQLIGILIRQIACNHIIILEMEYDGICDLQSRACEVVNMIINDRGGLPNHDYLIKVDKNSFYIIGHLIINNNIICFVQALNIPTTLLIYWNEIQAVYGAMQLFAAYTLKHIEQMHRNWWLAPSPNVLQLLKVSEHFAIGCIDSAYRQRQPLRYNLNNRQLIFAIFDTRTGNNLINLSNDSAPMLYEINNTVNLYYFPASQRIPYEYKGLIPSRSVRNQHCSACKLGPVIFRYSRQ